MKSILLRWLGGLLFLAFAFTSCKKAPPKKKREELVSDASRERRQVTNFANALRRVIEWRQGQPIADAEAPRRTLITSVVKKFDDIPAAGLPPELAKAWQQVLQSWHALAASTAADASLFKEGAAATAQLNQQLAIHGYPDLRL